MPTTVCVEDFLNQFINLERTRDFSYPLKKARMQELLARVGNPEKNLGEVILIAGSKGKGSTAAIIESVLRAHGLKTGFYSSPHLVTWHERICVDAQQITDDEAALFVAKLEQALLTQLKTGAPTYFEVLTTLAFMHFRTEKVDVAVLEVGLGGEFDATNASEPTLSVITPLGFEHQDILGPTLANIARAKCGIMRPKQLAIVASQSASARAEIEAEGKRRKAELIFVEDEVEIKALPTAFGQRVELTHADQKVVFKLPLRGWHQAQNAACAYLATKSWFAKQRRWSPKAAARGFADTAWSGRTELLQTKPDVMLDGAHSAESAQALKKTLQRHFKFRELYVILGMLRDKDPGAVMGALSELKPQVWLVPIKDTRAYRAPELHRALKDTPIKLRESNSFPEAYTEARQMAEPEDMILITGSLYLVGEAKQFFRSQ